MSKAKLTRRAFVSSTAAAVAAFHIVPRHAVAASGQRPPSEKLRFACIGVGGRGTASVDAVAGETIVALCDVDPDRSRKTIARFPQAKVFTDVRKMYDAVGKDIDAVTVGTPDHTHAVAAMGAIQRDKHVYCEKPLAHSIGEVRQLMKAAKEHNVVTQLGNQGHSSDSIRMLCEWVRDGAIGKVHTIHARCDSNYSRIRQLDRLSEKHEVPKGLDWDSWIGPAEFRPYNPVYMPGIWRGWMPFGCGVIGDWVCHVVDPVFWALDLGSPTTIQAQAKEYDPKEHGLTFPRGCVIKYQFRAKGERGPVTLYWRDGNEPTPRPDGLDANRSVPGTGAVVLGDKGGITYGSHGAGGVRIFPEAQMKAYKQPEKTIPRVPGGNHHGDWLEAIRKGRKAGSDFAYGGPLTEIALLGVIAIRLLGQELKWDGASMRFTNCEEANAMVSPPHRAGWTL